jgi:hypothetical protein
MNLLEVASFSSACITLYYRGLRHDARRKLKRERTRTDTQFRLKQQMIAIQNGINEAQQQRIEHPEARWDNGDDGETDEEQELEPEQPIRPEPFNTRVLFRT